MLPHVCFQQSHCSGQKRWQYHFWAKDMLNILDICNVTDTIPGGNVNLIKTIWPLWTLWYSEKWRIWSKTTSTRVKWVYMLGSCCPWIPLRYTQTPRHPFKLLPTAFRPQCSKVYFPCSAQPRPQRWSIFQSDGMVNVFFRPPLTSMVFRWFWQRWTITIECFLRAQPLVSMVFRWFSKFWGQWSTMVLRLTIVWMSHCKKCVKSIYDKTHILSRTRKWTSIESIWYGPYLFTPYITSQCEIHTIQQRKCLKCHVIQEETRLLYKSMQND